MSKRTAQRNCHTRIVRLETITRRPSSVNGNPSFKFYVSESESESGYELISSTDSSFCYEVGSPGLRECDLVKILLTRSGRVACMWPMSNGKV